MIQNHVFSWFMILDKIWSGQKVRKTMEKHGFASFWGPPSSDHRESLGNQAGGELERNFRESKNPGTVFHFKATQETYPKGRSNG